MNREFVGPQDFVGPASAGQPVANDREPPEGRPANTRQAA